MDSFELKGSPPSLNPSPQGGGELVTLLFLLTFLLFSFSAHAEAKKFYVPPSQFSAAFQIMKMGYANVLGLFGNGTAGLSYDEGEKKLSSIKLALDTASLTTSNGGNQRDLMQLFDTLKYRELTFVAPGPFEVKDGKAEIKGKLTLHGATKEAVFQATLNQAKGETIGLSLTGEIKRADFGMDDEASDGAKGFGDTLKLTLEMQAIAP